MAKLGEIIAVGSRSVVHAMGAHSIAKVPKPTTPDTWIVAEARHVAAVQAVGVRVPRHLDTIELDGRLVGVYERIYGMPMWHHAIRQPDLAEAFGAELGRIHGTILSAPVPVSLPRQRDRRGAKIRSAARSIDPDIGRAVDLIPANPPRLALCHGDLHPGNVIMSDAGPVVIDWFDASRGHAVADIARSSLLMGSGGLTDRTVDHLGPKAGDVLDAVHRSYLATMAPWLTVDRVGFERWRAIEAAARLAEGVPPTQLLGVWRSA